MKDLAAAGRVNDPEQKLGMILVHVSVFLCIALQNYASNLVISWFCNRQLYI
jgi:hypothetical protein